LPPGVAWYFAPAAFTDFLRATSLQVELQYR
jgi:hypothetical protein